MGFQESQHLVGLQIRVYWILEEQDSTKLSSNFVPNISKMHIFRSFENSKFYRVLQSFTEFFMPPCSLATSFESFSKHKKCYHFCVGNKGILFRNSFTCSVMLFVCFVDIWVIKIFKWCHKRFAYFLPLVLSPILQFTNRLAISHHLLDAAVTLSVIYNLLYTTKKIHSSKLWTVPFTRLQSLYTTGWDLTAHRSQQHQQTLEDINYC